ncbi:MAG: tetratricopeptide repeat protein, partial [Planctomycetes bacterium]|nr:tetratricopeptide repeat protein [Planctomycetota bacterium]
DNAFDAYRDIGFILSQRSDRMDEAVEAYRQAIRCDPAQSGIWTRIGLIFIHQSRLEEAVEALRNEIAGGGASENTYCSLGMAYQLQERHEEAVESFSRAPELRGRLSTGWRSR